MNTLKKSLLGASVALALGGVGIAPETQAVQVAANGVGQVLLAPVYYAREGETTKLTIVNTSMTHAVKVKAVFRSKIYSTEVLDFLLYLTPGDVWRGEVYNKDGEAWLRSTDDSVHNLPMDDSWAHVEEADVQLFDERMLSIGEGDINEVGHIEFIGHYSATDIVNTSFGPINIYRTMSKNDLKKLFDMDVNNSFTGSGIIQLNPGCLIDDGTGALPLYAGLSAPTCPVRVDDPDNLRLRGNVEIENADGRTAYQMTALASSRTFNSNLAPIGVTSFSNTCKASTGADSSVLKVDNLAVAQEVTGTHVIANGYNLEVTIAQETSIGYDWGWTRSEIALSPQNGLGWFGQYDNILEIERALATTKVNAAYENNGMDATKVQVTFPTKYRHRGYDVCTGNSIPGSTSKAPIFSPPFNVLGHVQYVPFSLDDFENSPGVDVRPGSSVSGASEGPPPSNMFIFDEVNTLPDDVVESAEDLFKFEQGQYQLDLYAQGGCGFWYAGVPAIAHTYKYTVDGSKNPLMIPASENKWQWQ